MRVFEARRIVRQWVENEANSLPGFQGAYLSGSMSALHDDAVLPDASDVDVKMLLDDPDVSPEPQKFHYRNLVLDVSYGSVDDVRFPETVLGTYYTAVHFTHPSILSDPSGHLAKIQAIVKREYARREWVRRRCEHAAQTLQQSLSRLNPSEPIHTQMLAWLFPIFFTPPMVLVADLRNPTHRRGLATFGRVVAKYGHPAPHKRVLGIVGSASMTREQVETLLAACAEAFDVAQAVRTTPFPLASNISDFARPIAIGGAQELIADGYHREAVPWIAFMHSLCQTVLQNDASNDDRSRLTPAYETLLRTLGVRSSEDLVERHDELRQTIPDLWNVTEEIIQTNPAIRD